METWCHWFVYLAQFTPAVSTLADDVFGLETVQNIPSETGNNDIWPSSAVWLPKRQWPRATFRTMQVLYHIGPASGAAKYWTTAKFDELASWCHSWWFPIVNLWKHFYWAILVVMGLRIFWRLPRWAFKERERTWLQTQDSWDKTWHEHCLSRWGYLRKHWWCRATIGNSR